MSLEQGEDIKQAFIKKVLSAKAVQNKALKEAKAWNLLLSPRGEFIISQALCLAVKELKSRPPTRQEPNNVQDMETLIEGLFPIFRAMETALEAEMKKDWAKLQPHEETPA